MKRAILLLVVIVFIGTLVLPVKNIEASFRNQISPETQKAQELMNKMSPEERVGQLFLVTFKGSNTGSDSKISKLIHDQHIGGVVFRADNDNFSTIDNLPGVIQSSINNLQIENWKSTITGIQTESGSVQPGGVYVPLFIGISQEGDLAPYDQIINGLTPLPSAMAIGATWKPANAEQVGKVLGSELNALGFNMVFGPSLDVLDFVRTDVGEDLGVRTFGGDPYWVGQFGKSYVQGIHEGSENQILVIAKHFPGRGGSDRLPEDEVATVRKSLEQLKQIELSPFSTVTQQHENSAQTIDGLLLSHIRYQGFQGNIRATTRPVSFDETALEQIMALDPFSTWREQGGLIISDDLGSVAVQKFFAPSGSNFDARQVAKSALLAGNDLLYLGNIKSTNDDSSYTTVVKTHEYFVQKYKEDPVFQQRVDKAVLRILTAKFTLYPFFSLGAITTSTNDLEKVGVSPQVSFDVARQSITLVSPSLKDLNTDLPNPPNNEDRIVFISDIVPQYQCSSCQDQSIFLAKELMNAIVKLYGSTAGDLIQLNHLNAYSFDEINSLLNGNENTQEISNNLSQTDWVVVAFSEFRMNSKESTIFQRLFSEKPDIVQNKKVIGFAFNAPYYPDATNISKFTAYYALYSKIPQFIEIAARTLFKEITPTGILPVSVSSVGYDLITATTPDPSQIIPLMVVAQAENQGEQANSSTSNNEILTIKAGDNLPLQTGIIKDHNGNQVPDGTIVRFIIDTQTASGTVEQIESQTQDGIAKTVYRIPDKGTVKLSVIAEPALISQILQLDVTNEGGTLTSFEPTFAPTVSKDTPLPTPVIPSSSQSSESKHQQGLPGFLDWLFSTLIVGLFGFTLFEYGKNRRLKNWNLGIIIISGMMGFLFYLFPLLGIPLTQRWIQRGGTLAITLLTFGGCLVGVILGIVFSKIKKPN